MTRIPNTTIELRCMALLTPKQHYDTGIIHSQPQISSSGSCGSASEMAKGQDVTVTTFEKLSDYLRAHFVTAVHFASQANSYDALKLASRPIIAR